MKLKAFVHQKTLLRTEKCSHYGEQCGDSLKNWK